MKYYQVVLLRSSAPTLTYQSEENFTEGNVVVVPLKTTCKEAVIVAKVAKPKFLTEKIISTSTDTYHTLQMQIAEFISKYYFSSFSEAISLFIPYKHTEQNNETFIIRTEKKVVLSNMQQKAYESILTKDKSLLFGVTGSGKTEIFISLFAKMLEEGKTSIFLMPEISLTPQMEKRLKVYFGDTVAMWHSKLTKKKKESILARIEEGNIRIIAGARSALFVPLKNL